MPLFPARRSVFLLKTLLLAAVLGGISVLPANAQHDHSSHDHHAHPPEPELSPDQERGKAFALGLAEIPDPSELNLDFEDGDSPAPWLLGGRGYSLELDHGKAASGERSLRIRYEGSGRFAVASLPFDAGKARGKRLRLTGRLASEGVAQGHAGLWMRVDVGNLMAAFDNMDRRGVSGDTPWTPYVVELDVPEEATRIFFGAVLTGIGTVWVDDVSIEVVEVTPPEKVEVVGRVVDAAGQGVPGARVALASGDELLRGAITDEKGAFTFADVDAGEYALSAATAELTARSATLDGTGAPRTLTLGSGEQTVSGSVHGEDGFALADAELELVAWTADGPAVFTTRTDKEGAFAVALPKGEPVTARLVADRKTAVGRWTGEGPLDLHAVSTEVPPNGMVADFTVGSIVLATTHPLQPVGDLEDAAPLFDGARVVALGQAAPGTKELFELRHRLFDFLVEHQGFGVLALPVDPDLAEAVDRFARSGEGDPHSLLADFPGWSWRTREAAELLRSLHPPREGRSLKVIGYGSDGPPEERIAGLAALLAEDPERKIVLWGSHEDVARAGSSVGARLAEKLGPAYFAVGGFFSQGAFLAVGPDGGEPRRFWLGPAGKESLEHLMGRLGGKLSIQGLRRFEEGSPVARWLSTPRPVREFGETFLGEKSALRSRVFHADFDAFFFVESTTRARLLDEPEAAGAPSGP